MEYEIIQFSRLDWQLLMHRERKEQQQDLWDLGLWAWNAAESNKIYFYVICGWRKVKTVGLRVDEAHMKITV